VVTYTCENCYTIHKGPVSICRNCKLAGTVKRWESFEYD
jgi:RNA polymerase subunit RPABC4/transcription elongation factor Spt4